MFNLSSLGSSLALHGYLELVFDELGEAQLAELCPFHLVLLTTEEGHDCSSVFLLKMCPEGHDRTSELGSHVCTGLLLACSEEFDPRFLFKDDRVRDKNATGLDSLGSVGSAHHLLEHARLELGPFVENDDVGFG